MVFNLLLYQTIVKLKGFYMISLLEIYKILATTLIITVEVKTAYFSDGFKS